MRGKRSKQYRRLMDRLCRGFGFREPYQVVVDAEYIKETSKCRMDLVARLTQVLHGQIKPIVTQCSIRHLYAEAKDSFGLASVVELAKTFERRRCGHHPDKHPEPLPEAECIMSIVGPTNKHRYVVASQDADLRRELRQIPGVPLVYINRSVTIMEPMSNVTVELLDKGERAKFRGGLKATGTKRKRGEGEEEGSGGGGEGRDEEWKGFDDGDGQGGEGSATSEGGTAQAGNPRKRDAPTAPPPKKRKTRGKAKGPNPLSVKRAKKRSPKQSST